jgi:hypothetical protein
MTQKYLVQESLEEYFVLKDDQKYLAQELLEGIFRIEG